jgi:PKD repeat protein
MARSLFGKARFFALVSTLFFAAASLASCAADAPQEESDLSVEMVEATPMSGQAPLEVSFSVVANTSTEPLYVQWAFGDGATGTGTEVTHTYTEVGEYTATATVSDALGGSTVKSLTISVVPAEAATASVTATPESGIAPLNVSFTANVTGGSGEYSYAWDFGDGSTGTGKTPSHRYETAGTFTASVVVTDTATGVDSDPATTEIRVADNETPVASASASPSSGIVPLTVSFNGSVVGGNEPFTYEWSFGDGSASTDAQNPSHEYTTPGTFSAVFKVTDADGQTATDRVQIQVADNSAPITEIAASPQSGIAPLSVQFDPQVQGGDAPLEFAWDFGDGETSSARKPSHTFQAAGDYAVSVTVTDANGDVATDSITVTATDNTVPSVGPTATPESGLAPLQVQFSSNASGGDGSLSYAWNFGDGNTSTSANPVHTYQTAGQFNASVTVTDANGDSASGSVQIDVGSDLVPSASASATPKSGYAPLQVQFFGSASGGNAPLNYAWNFGDGNSASDQNPTHVYQSPGTYTATVVVTDDNGDSDSATVVIEVNDNSVPQVSASASPNSGIVPFNVNFNAAVANGDAPFTYEWNFGDGTPTSTVQNPSHSYTTAGSHTATVTVTDANGDTDSDTVTIQAADNSQPAVTASADTTTGAAPMSVSFSASASGGNAPLTYTWYFGDGTSPQSGQSVSHTYNNIGVYDAQVVVTDADGDTASDTIQINALAMAPDLAVQSFTAVATGSDVQYEVVIENRGTTDATASFFVRFFHDLSAAPDDTTSYDISEYVSQDVPVGQTVTVTTGAANLPIGDYDSYMLIDPYESNPDLDRTNNVGGPQSYTIEKLLINELLYRTAGSDTGTFIELYGTPGMDISGYSLEGINGSTGSSYDTLTFPQGTTMPQDGYLVVGDGSAANEDITDAFADLQNGEDSLVLKDDTGAVIDAVGYGDFSAAPGNFAGEGASTDDAPDDYSLGRDADGTDTGDNSVDFYMWRVPTPGAANTLTLTNSADTCGDAYELAAGVAGRFVVQSDLGGLTNDFTSLAAGGSGTCTATGNTFGGPDQVFSFTVPSGMTADVMLDLDDNANVDLDSVLTGSPCTDLDSAFVGCNIGFTENFTGLTAGTYYLIVMEDSSTSSAGISEPYEYIVDIDLY